MTFKDDTPRLTLVGTDIAAGGERIEEAFRRLIEDTRAWLALSEDPRADLLGYSPTTWFRFVAPEDLYPKERPKTLAERLEEAYRDDELEPQEREFLDLTREHFSRLDDE